MARQKQMIDFTPKLRVAAEKFCELRGLRGRKIDEIELAMQEGAAIAVASLTKEIRHEKEDLQQRHARNLAGSHEPRNEIRFERPK